jgi:hypothetical protein
MARLIELGVIALLSAAVLPREQASAVPQRVCRVDEAAREPSLTRFRSRLLAAAKSREIERLRPLVWPRVSLTAGAPVHGFEALRRSEHLDDKTSPFWPDLETMLGQGGVFDGSDFCAPYISCPAPPPWAGSLVILGERVPAYEQPRASSAVVGVLSCDVLHVPDEGMPPSIQATKDFTPVLLPKGGWGYVESRFVGIAASYLHIGRRDGRWLLVSFGGFD